MLKLKELKRVRFQDDSNELCTNNLNTTADGEKVPNPEVVGAIASQPSQCECSI